MGMQIILHSGFLTKQQDFCYWLSIFLSPFFSPFLFSFFKASILVLIPQLKAKIVYAVVYLLMSGSQVLGQIGPKRVMHFQAQMIFSLVWHTSCSKPEMLLNMQTFSKYVYANPMQIFIRHLIAQTAWFVYPYSLPCSLTVCHQMTFEKRHLLIVTVDRKMTALSGGADVLWS